MSELQSWEEDPALYLFTSLTAGSSHIVTATSRIETILKNARIPFSYIDTATNESARKLYGRRGKNRKLPLLVKEGFVIAVRWFLPPEGRMCADHSLNRISHKSKSGTSLASCTRTLAKYPRLQLR